MKTRLTKLIFASLTAFFFYGLAQAADQEKMVIKLKTSDFEISETDISGLAVGEAQTIVTDSGKTVDILRTDSGVEVYVDGELLDSPGLHEGHHQAIGHRVEIECVSDGTEGADPDCGSDMLFLSDADIDIDDLHADGGQRHVIVKRLSAECESDQESECDDEQIWVSDDSDLEFGNLHEAEGGTHRVIRIQKSSGADAGDISAVEKVVVIERETTDQP